MVRAAGRRWRLVDRVVLLVGLRGGAVSAAGAGAAGGQVRGVAGQVRDTVVLVLFDVDVVPVSMSAR